MNHKLGFISAVILTATVILFAISMLISSPVMPYAVCILMSWSYLLTACALAAEAGPERKAVAAGGVAFACLYAVFIGLVYYTQLTAVLYATEAPDVVAAISYMPGSWFFALDLFGYGLMSISTLLIGLAFSPKDKLGKWLRTLLMIHGVFTVCMLFPALNLLKPADPSGGMDIGVMILLFWCVYFAPLAVLAAVHFKKAQKE